MEPNDAASTSVRAQELRANLGTRREVEALLAEASATREAAVSDADAIIEEAQQVSEQLLRESRSEAEQLAADARSRAEGVVARARTEAEDITRQARAAADAVRARAEAQVEEHRRRVRAELLEQVTREVTEQSRRELARVHERQQGMIGDIEASVRILGVSMEAAVGNISEMLAALDSLRTHTADSLGDNGTGVPMTTPPRHAEPIDHLIRATTPDQRADGARDGLVGDGDTTELDLDDFEPVEELDADDVDEVEADDLDGPDGLDDPEDADPPRTATEAYLRSAHLDHGDPPLPPMDDSDIGARYARDAMRATARAKTRSAGAGEEAELDPPEGDLDPDDDGAGKPLGWLFRSN